MGRLAAVSESVVRRVGRGLLSYVAAPLAAVLNPVSSLNDMASRQPTMALEAAAFRALREEFRAADPDWAG
jgi:hypothetical protein